jgi:hypothetical protein
MESLQVEGVGPVSTSFSDTKRKTLEQRKAALVEEYEAANAQLGQALDNVARLRIQRQIGELETQIKDVEKQIEDLDQQPVPPQPPRVSPIKARYRVLIDEYHGEELFGSRQKRQLESLGFECVTIKQAYSSQMLSEFDVLAIWFARYFEGRIPQFSEDEVSMIRDYIDRGGNAFLIGLGWVWRQYEKRPIEEYPLNLIVQDHGIFFTETMISEVAGVHYKDSPITFSKPFMAEHAITQGVNVTGAPDSVSGSLLVDPPAIPIIWGDDNTKDSDGVQNPVVLAVTSARKGRIVCLQHANYVKYLRYDNAVLLENILTWLVSGDRHLQRQDDSRPASAVPVRSETESETSVPESTDETSRVSHRPGAGPGPEEAGPSTISQWLGSLGGRIQWLWLAYLAWLVISALGFVASLVDVFGLTPCPRYQIFTLLAFLGGVAILGFSFVSRYKSHYKNWDRWLTFVLLVVATGSLALLAYQSCTTKPFSAEYQVRVEVKGTAEVIQNAKVTLEMGSGRAPKNEFTDTNGIARIPFDASLASKPARLIVEAVGYRRIVENIDLVANELPHVVQLEPES